MSAIPFTNADFNSVELVRQIVLRRLKDGQWNQLYDGWEARQVAQYVTFTDQQVHRQFIVLMLEVMWQLIIQGVITPGIDASNAELPWFRVTSYGKEVLRTERFVPHDPTGYIAEVKGVSKSAIGLRALPYLEEALRCFTASCNVASVMLLGIGAEAVFLGLCEVVATKIKDPREQETFEKLQWIKPKHRWIVTKFQALPKNERKKLPESIDVTLASLYDLIRRQRNDIGHPRDKAPEIGRDQAFVYFRLFPTFIEDVEAFAKYCRAHGL